MSKAIQLLLVYLLLSTLVSACNHASKPERISIDEAHALIQDAILEESSDMNPDVKFTLKELTTDEIWQRIGAQVFVLEGHIVSFWSAETYIIVDGQVDRLGTAFGGYGVTSMCVTDLDQNDEAELTYTYSWGSGLHRSHVAVYLPRHLGTRDIDADLVYLHGDLLLEKVDDQDVLVKAGYHDWRQDDFVEVSALGKVLLEDQEGQYELLIRLEDDVPSDVMKWVVFP
jgi:hypothetical protein